MDPNPPNSAASFHRIPPPKDVDPPRQRIDVAVSSPMYMRANALSVSVVEDGRLSVQGGPTNSNDVLDVLRRIIPANSSIVLRPLMWPRPAPIRLRAQSLLQIMADHGARRLQTILLVLEHILRMEV